MPLLSLHFSYLRLCVFCLLLGNGKNGRPVVRGQAKYVHDLIAVHVDEGGTMFLPTRLTKW